MGQRKKELIALKNAGMRKGGKPAKPNAKVVGMWGSWKLDRNTNVIKLFDKFSDFILLK